MESAKMPVSGWMDKENLISVHNGVLFNHKEEWNSVICKKMDVTGGHYVRRNKSDTERQTLHVWSHM